MPEQEFLITGQLRGLGPVENYKRADGKETAFRRVCIIQDHAQGGVSVINARLWRQNGAWPARVAELEKQIGKEVTVPVRVSSEKNLNVLVRA